MKITESKLRALIQECINEAMFHIQQSEKVKARNEKRNRIKTNLCEAICNVIVEEYGSLIVKKESIMFAMEPILNLISRTEHRTPRAI